MTNNIDEQLENPGEKTLDDGIFDSIQSGLFVRTRRELKLSRKAAVLIIMVDDGGPLRLILTRRSEELLSHKGQVAFPGGGLEPGDSGAVVGAALRETYEEIGLEPGQIRVLGTLDDFPTLNNDVVVTPVVGVSNDVSNLRASPEEVARIFDIPIDLLCDPNNWVQKIERRYSDTWPVFYFDHDGEVLWGLSAYITLHFLEVCGFGRPFDLSAAADRLPPG